MKRIVDSVWRIVVAVIILFVLHILIGNISLNEALGGIGWILLSCLLVVMVMTWIVMASHAYGLRLVWPIVLVFFGIYVFNVHVEALFFQLTIPQKEVFGMMLRGLLLSLVFSPILLILMDKVKQPAAFFDSTRKRRISVVGSIWKTIVCMIIYVIIYFIAGALVYPYIKDFYAEMARMPALQHIFIMQLLRGSVYVLVVIPIIRIVKINKLATALMIGLLLSVLGGVAPLLFPNPYMPSPIRFVHGIEIGISNFVFGFIIGSLFGMKPVKKI